MQTILYDGSYGEFLCAVFDVYDYKFVQLDVCTKDRFKGNIFDKVHQVHFNKEHSDRVLKGLKQKVSGETLFDIYRVFLSEVEGIENTLLRFIQYIFSNKNSIEKDFSHPAVIAIADMVKKVRREKHRMEAFIRFQKTKDGMFYAIIEPDFNVLPLIIRHFKNRYADQVWIIYDTRRKFGIHYDGISCSEITIDFSTADMEANKDETQLDEQEELYQKLWQSYFKSINIEARKNTKLHLQHVPRRYWRYLTEKQVML
jgi:probable DNA metabolism protein